MRRPLQFGTQITMIVMTVALFGGCRWTGETLARFNPLRKPSLREQLPPSIPQSQLAMASSTPEPLTPKAKADVQMVVAKSFEQRGKIDTAIEAYQQVVRHDPKRADAYHRLAILHDKSGDHEGAKKNYDEAIRRDGGNPELLADYGYSLYLQQRWQEADTALRRALTLKRNLPRAHNNLGLVLARTGQYDAALAEFACAGCSEAEARANLAHAMLLEKRWGEASQQCQMAMAMPSNSAKLTARLQQLHAMVAEAAPGHGPLAQPPASPGYALPTQTHPVGQASFEHPAAGSWGPHLPAGVNRL